MNRYIDADALIDTFEAKKAKAHDKSMKHLYGQNKNDKLYRKDRETESRCEYVLSVLRTTPTLDAVPVVRCRECENWDTEYSSGRKSIGNYRCICHEWSNDKAVHYATPFEEYSRENFLKYHGKDKRQ